MMMTACVRYDAAARVASQPTVAVASFTNFAPPSPSASSALIRTRTGKDNIEPPPPTRNMDRDPARACGVFSFMSYNLLFTELEVGSSHDRYYGKYPCLVGDTRTRDGDTGCSLLACQGSLTRRRCVL